MTNTTPVYLVPAFQKITATNEDCSESFFGAEFLARWVASNGSFVPSDMRIIDWVQTDALMLSTLCHGLDYSKAMFQHIFINVSNETFASDAAFCEWLSILIKLRERSDKVVVVEITERITPKNLYLRWRKIKKHGFSMALDDFGAYYSTIGRLKAYEWDFCKFDESQLFTLEVSNAIQFCKGNGIAMIAECIESSRMQMFARARGLLNQQGYFHHKPELISFTSQLEAQHVRRS